MPEKKKRIWQNTGNCWYRNYGLVTVCLYCSDSGKLWWYTASGSMKTDMSKTFKELEDCLGDMVAHVRSEGARIVSEASNLNTGIEEIKE